MTASFFPLFHPYPITDQELTQEEWIESKFNPNPNEIYGKTIIISTPLELLIYTINKQTSGITIKFDDLFDNHRQQAKNRRIIPKFKDIPKSKRYQQTSSGSPVLMGSEIDEYGAFLCPGQTLFHGGDFDLTNKSLLTQRPFSTTFSPLIALWHADNDGIGKWNYRDSAEPPAPKHPTVLIISITTPIKAIIFHTGGANMADEKEALLPAGVIIAFEGAPIICRDVQIIFANASMA
jgi:hypothetical protein